MLDQISMAFLVVLQRLTPAEASELDWTIARPPRLTNGPRTGDYGIVDDHLPAGAGANATISRADVAHFLLDELEHPRHVRRIVGLAYTKTRRLSQRPGLTA